MKYKKKLEVKDFLYLVRGECGKGCSACKFRNPKVEPVISEKICVFRDFKIISPKSIDFILSIAQTFDR